MFCEYNILHFISSMTESLHGPDTMCSINEFWDETLYTLGSYQVQKQLLCILSSSTDMDTKLVNYANCIDYLSITIMDTGCAV